MNETNRSKETSTVWLVHVFFLNIASLDLNIIMRTDEMDPNWFDEENIPFGKMWEDDVLWYPVMLKGSKFSGECHFLESKSKSSLPKMTSHAIEIVSHLEDLDPVDPMDRKDQL